MPFIAVPNTTEVIIHYQNGTNLYENVIHYLWTGTAPTSSQLLALATAVANGVGMRLRDCVSASWIFREVVATNLNIEAGATNSYQWPTNTTGTRAGAQVAASEAAGIIKRTGLAGRGQHGRMSVSGFTEPDVDGNSLGSAIIAALVNLGIELLVAYVGGQFSPALAHKHPRVGAPYSNRMTQTAILDSNIDSQKTRLNSHGR